MQNEYASYFKTARKMISDKFDPAKHKTTCICYFFIKMLTFTANNFQINKLLPKKEQNAVGL